MGRDGEVDDGANKGKGGALIKLARRVFGAVGVLRGEYFWKMFLTVCDRAGRTE